MLTAIAAILLGIQSGTPQQPRAYHKAFPDGTEIYLSRQTIRELRSRPQSINNGIGAEQLFVDKEFKVVTDSLYLKESGKASASLIWRNEVDYPADDAQIVERFHIIDTLVSRNKREAYVIYGTIFTITVEGFSRIETGDWIRGSKVDLAKKSEIRPPVNVKFLDRKTPEIYLEILARDRKGDQKLLPEVWVLNGRDWRRRVLRARDLDR